MRIEGLNLSGIELSGRDLDAIEIQFQGFGNQILTLRGPKNGILSPPGRPWTPRGANRTTPRRSYAGKMAVGAVKFRFWTERNEIGRPRRPFYLHMSAIGWSDLPPAGLKGALEGPKSFKFLPYYRVIC